MGSTGKENKASESVLLDFLFEAEAMLDNIERDLLEYEENSDTESLNRVYRAFHTIHSNVVFHDMSGIVRLVHICEELMSCIRAGDIEVDKDLISNLLKAKDELSSVFTELREERILVEPDRGLMSRLENKLGKKLPLKAAGDPVLNIDRSRRRFLIVEDDFVSRSILNTFLAQYALIDVAVSGEEAVEIFRKTMNGTFDWKYDLICMDILMPQLNGLEATRQIRCMEKEVGVKPADETTIIMVSSMNDPKTVIKSLYSNGANAFITKPIDLKKLLMEMNVYNLI